MSSAYYVKTAGMNIAEILQKIPEIWKECGSHETTFQYRKQRCMKTNYDKHHGHHAHVTKKKVRHRERLCYCCRQKGHPAKDCSRNKIMNTSNPRMTGNSIWAVWSLFEVIKSAYNSLRNKKFLSRGWDVFWIIFGRWIRFGVLFLLLSVFFKIFTILYIFFTKYLIWQIFLLTYITTFEPETPAGHPKYQKTRIVA